MKDHPLNKTSRQGKERLPLILEPYFTKVISLKGYSEGAEADFRFEYVNHRATLKVSSLNRKIPSFVVSDMDKTAIYLVMAGGRGEVYGTYKGHAVSLFIEKAAFEQIAMKLYLKDDRAAPLFVYTFPSFYSKIFEKAVLNAHS